MKDQPVLMYVKDNTLYPMALNKEQEEMFDFYMHIMPGKMVYIKDRPIGQVIEKPKKACR